MCLLTICMSYLEKGLFKPLFHLKHWVVCRVPPSAPAGGVGVGEASLERSPRRRGPRAGASLAASQGRRFLSRARRRGDAQPPAPVPGVPRSCCAARTRRRRGGSCSALVAAHLSAPAVCAPLPEVGVPARAHLPRGVLGVLAVGAARAGGGLGRQRAAAGNDPSRGSLAPQRHPSAERRVTERR